MEYELNVQLMDPQTEHTLSYDPLDDTKIWSEEQFPLMPVGKLTLERNPENYAAQVEKLAFSPANLVDGIEFSDDKMLQGRSFIYWMPSAGGWVRIFAASRSTIWRTGSPPMRSAKPG